LICYNLLLEVGNREGDVSFSCPKCGAVLAIPPRPVRDAASPPRPASPSRAGGRGLGTEGAPRSLSGAAEGEKRPL